MVPPLGLKGWPIYIYIYIYIYAIYVTIDSGILFLPPDLLKFPGAFLKLLNSPRSSILRLIESLRGGSSSWGPGRIIERWTYTQPWRHCYAVVFSSFCLRITSCKNSFQMITSKAKLCQNRLSNLSFDDLSLHGKFFSQ